MMTPSRPAPSGETGPRLAFRSLSQLAREALRLTRLPLYRSASALILSNIANGVLGLLYWILAARLYSAEAVGQGAAAVAGLLLVSMLGWSGLQSTLIRFIPASGRGTMRLARTAYIAASAIGLLCGGALLLVAVLFIEPLRFLTDYLGAGFFSAILVWTVFSLQDGILIGLRRAGWVPLENTIFGLVKIGLLVTFSALGSGAWVIFASWSIAALIVAVPVNLWLFLKFIPEHAKSNVHRTGEFTATEIVRFSTGNHASQLLVGLPDGLMPIIVLHLLGPQANAYFYVPRTMILSLRQVAISVGNALTAEGAADERYLTQLTQKAGMFTAAVFLPLILALLFQSRAILQTFGPEYVENGVRLTQLFAIGLIPLAFTSLYMAVARVRRQVTRLVVLGVVWSGLSISLSVTLIPEFGIEGAGMAWLISHASTAAVAVVMSALHLFEVESSDLVKN